MKQGYKQQDIAIRFERSLSDKTIREGSLYEKIRKELDTSIKLNSVDFNTKIKTNNSDIKMLKND